MSSLDEILAWNKDELAEGWRFGIWRNATLGVKGDYVRGEDQKILRFERTSGAYLALKTLGFVYHIGPLPQRAPAAPPAGRGKGKRKVPLSLPLPLPGVAPSAYVCAVPPDISD